MVPSSRCGWGDSEPPWAYYPPIMTGPHGWRQRRPCSNSRDGEPPTTQAPPYPRGLYLRLVRPSPEIYQRTRPSDVVVEPATSVVEPIGSASDVTRPGTERSGGRTRRKRGADVLIYHPPAGADRPRPHRLPAIVWFETEFFVFQSTENSQVHVGGGFGYDRVTWAASTDQLHATPFEDAYHKIRWHDQSLASARSSTIWIA